MPIPKKVEAACDRIDAANARLFRFGEFVELGTASLVAAETETGDPSYRPVATVERLLPDLRREAKETWRSRRSLESAVGVVFERAFRALDLAVGVSQECTRRLTNRVPHSAPEPVAYAVSSLAVRAQSTTHEICALLRAAMVNGAQARWRTLHEVAVVSGVLSLGNRYTAGRYNNHRWVTLALDLDHPTPGMKWQGPGPAPAVMRDRLVKRYGKAYGGRYGWASQVTKRHLGVEFPSWYHLERLARLADGHRQRVKIANHSVHADALGVLNLIGSSGLLHAGAGLDGVAEISWQTIRTLRETTALLLAIWERYDPSPQLSASRQLADEIFFQAEVMVIDSHDERS